MAFIPSGPTPNEGTEQAEQKMPIVVTGQGRRTMIVRRVTPEVHVLRTADVLSGIPAHLGAAIPTRAFTTSMVAPMAMA